MNMVDNLIQKVMNWLDVIINTIFGFIQKYPIMAVGLLGVALLGKMFNFKLKM